MIFMVTVTYPSHLAKELVKKFKRIDLPAYIKKWQIYGVANGIKGLKSYQLVFCEKGKGDEAIIFIHKVFAEFIEIEGYEIKVEVIFGLKDSMSIFGM